MRRDKGRRGKKDEQGKEGMHFFLFNSLLQFASIFAVSIFFLASFTSERRKGKRRRKRRKRRR